MSSPAAPIVYGLGGVTCGGKTTVSDFIKEELKTESIPVFHQDDYYWPEDHSHWKYDGKDNWDELAAFDMNKLLSDIQEEINNNTALYIIVEGIMLYDDRRLEELITHKYFFTLPFDECKKRRVLKNYQPPEPYPEYFEDVYWPMYQLQLHQLSGRHDIRQVDATNSLEMVKQFMLSEMRNSIGDIKP